MRDLMLNLFGTYSPIMYSNAQGLDIIPSGAAGVDWTYVLGIGLFALFLYSIFRLIGGVFNALFRH